MTALSPSLTARTARPVTASQPATRQARGAKPVPRLRYIVVVLTGIFSILGIQLLLSIAVSGGAYEIAALKGDMRKSEQELQIVAEDISALVAPSTLAGLATAMGMVADNNPAYLKLSTGEVMGEALPAGNSSGSLQYSVTAGGEPETTPAIVDSVMRSIATQDATVADAESGDVAIPATTEPENAGDQVMTPVATPVVTPVTPVQASPPSAPRLGGSIPSPVTR